MRTMSWREFQNMVTGILLSEDSTLRRALDSATPREAVTEAEQDAILDDIANMFPGTE